MTGHMHAIGLGHPDQRDTQVSCVGVVLTAHGQTFDDVYAHRMVKPLREQIADKRRTPAHNAVRLKYYPENAIEYMEMAPPVHARRQPPIESQPDIAKLKCVLRCIASRNTSKAVREAVGPVANWGTDTVSRIGTEAAWPMGAHMPLAGLDLSARGNRMLADGSSSR